MQVVLDVDALAKLAHWDLLDDLPRQFQCDVSAFSTVSSLAHRARTAAQGRKDRLFASVDVAERLARFVEGFSALGDVDENHVISLQALPQVDPGEALLMSAAIVGHALLVTGDKRALKALASGAPNIAAVLSGRVICLEQVIRTAVHARGLGWVQPRIAPHIDLDMAIHACMGSRADAPLHAVLDGLQSYETELRSSTGSLLRRIE